MAKPVEIIHHDVYAAIDPAGALRGTADGLNVAITGASRGCGRAMAVAFAQAGAAKLLLFGRDMDSLVKTAQLCEAANGNSKTFQYVIDFCQTDLQTPLAQMLQVSQAHKKCCRLCFYLHRESKTGIRTFRTATAKRD